MSIIFRWKWLPPVVFLTILLWLLWPFLTSRRPHYADIEEHFKYGSIGGESTDGIPYELWKALPKIFSEYLPYHAGDGRELTAFGFAQEESKQMPIGFVKSSRKLFPLLGIDVVTQNCATCHVGKFRNDSSAKTELFTTMPSHNVDLQSYIQFLTKCGDDTRFTADHILPQLEGLNPLEKLIYKFVVIPRTQKQLKAESDDFAFMRDQSRYGPGRVDTFTSYKTRKFGYLPHLIPKEQLKGISDFPSIWNQEPRSSLHLHWDGNNNDADERNRTAALALVAPANLDFKSLKRIRLWLNQIKAPAYPFDIDPVKAKTGKAIFQENCAKCHEREQGDERDTVIPIDIIKTDRGRLDSYTNDLKANQYLIFSDITFEGQDKRFKSYRKTNGYATPLLDGIWLRSPYLHNGSVPTLTDLLSPISSRPVTFYRGYDVYDPVRVGFRTDVKAEGQRDYFLYDTKKAGNGNFGHEYGLDLSPEDKLALLEYLKTL